MPIPPSAPLLGAHPARSCRVLPQPVAQAACCRQGVNTPPTRCLLLSVAHHICLWVQKMVAESEAVKDAVAFTQKVLDARSKYMRIISEAFAGDRVFTQALNSSFEVRAPFAPHPVGWCTLDRWLASHLCHTSYAHGMGDRQGSVQTFLNAFNRSPEYISLYIDSKLKKGLAAASDSQADEALDKVLQIFRCATTLCFGVAAQAWASERRPPARPVPRRSIVSSGRRRSSRQKR